MPGANGKGRILIGLRSEFLGKEKLTGHRPHRVENKRISNATSFDLLGDEPFTQLFHFGHWNLLRPGQLLNYIPISGTAEPSGLGSGKSVIVASVSRSTLATETAFSKATRTTLVGSMMPASTRSTY